MTRRNQAGFTLIEASVCIVIISLLAAITFPNMIREADRRNHRFLKTKIQTLVSQAKNRAIDTRTTVALSFDKGTKTLAAIEEDANGVSKPLPDITLPDDVNAVEFYADKDESPNDGWRVPFFLDGATTGGGIEFQEGGATYSLVIDAASGKPTFLDGKLPDLANQTWNAGGVQPRA